MSKSLNSICCSSVKALLSSTQESFRDIAASAPLLLGHRSENAKLPLQLT